MTKPIGKAKAVRFAAVEGLTKSSASRVLADQLRELKGDTYRSEVTKAFKKA